MKYRLYRVARCVITVFMKVFYRVEINGKENLIYNDSIILAGNHTNNLDALLVMSSYKCNVRFLAKKELFKGVFNKLFLMAGVIPVDRGKKDDVAKTVSINALNNKETLCIFPEGTINRGKDTILPFKYGVVSFASKTNSYVIPFVIRGKYKLFRRCVSISYLEPYKLVSDDLDIENDKLMSIIKGELER